MSYKLYSWDFQNIEIKTRRIESFYRSFHPYEDGGINFSLKIFVTINLYEIHKEIKKLFTIFPFHLLLNP